jgi:hypothetical protein
MDAVPTWIALGCALVISITTMLSFSSSESGAVVGMLAVIMFVLLAILTRVW